MYDEPCIKYSNLRYEYKKSYKFLIKNNLQNKRFW